MQAVRMAIMLVLVSMLAFALLAVSPIDPLQTNIGQAALGAMSAEQIEKLEAYWGVGAPAAEWMRFTAIWGCRSFTGGRWRRSSGKSS